jgi:hypothetical protein
MHRTEEIMLNRIYGHGRAWGRLISAHGMVLIGTPVLYLAEMIKGLLETHGWIGTCIVHLSGVTRTLGEVGQ